MSPNRAAQKTSKHVDAKVAARNAALNSMGGVKVDVFVRVRPPMEFENADKVNVIVHDDTHEIELVDTAGTCACDCLCLCLSVSLFLYMNIAIYSIDACYILIVAHSTLTTSLYSVCRC